MISKSLSISLLALLLPAAALQAATPANAEDAFKKIAQQLKSGDVESALKSMTPPARKNFLANSLGLVADTVSAGENFPETLPDSVTAASLGFDTFKFPAWYTDETAPDPSEADYEAFEKNLMNLIDLADDKRIALKTLHALSTSVEPSEFSGKIVPAKEDIPPSAGRVWVEVDYGEGAKETLALTFEKKQDQWLYAGWDWEAIEAEKRRFVEIKDLKISGKTIAGKDLSLSDLKEKVVLIDFWGTW